MKTDGPARRQPGVVRRLKYVRSWWPPESVSPVPMVIEGDCRRYGVGLQVGRVDTSYGEVHNHPMRRLVAAMVVLALSASVASMTCAGWQATAAGRMDCCESAHDGCADQLSADACCAQTEQGQQQLLVAVANFPVSLVAVAAAPPSIIEHPQPRRSGRVRTRAAPVSTQSALPQRRPSDLIRPSC